MPHKLDTDQEVRAMTPTRCAYRYGWATGFTTGCALLALALDLPVFWRVLFEVFCASFLVLSLVLDRRRFREGWK